MKRTRLWFGALGVVASAVLLAACGSADDSEQPAAAAQQTVQAEPAEQEARVQVIRDRAYLGSADAPVVIQEYSDFL